MKRFILVLLFAIYFADNTTSQEIQVMTLGTFHFDFPNRDIIKVDDSDQIDVLSPQYQKEIKGIVKKILKFRPTAIAIELSPNNQHKLDSTYHAYLRGEHTLNRDEYEQIGFRLGKMLHLKKLYCVNDWGRNYRDIDSIFNDKKSDIRSQFMESFYKNPDSMLMYNKASIFKTEGILAQLKASNDKNHHIKNLGNYLISIFKFETDNYPYYGVDFTTGWWFNRNLRIFRNIQKIKTTPTDRILVIYGTGHLNLLNVFFESSPEYNLVDTNSYLD